eukprot:CAMPEP_0185569566 /NCGR_PEP_ID=MMETSP0434-20130131/2146_1 /TAXON_ID=626734 ORGANISM="Favella taraikaensis, Strain Fe Narragansett Bay" /NCGR_SAMPLE_ID=MMETSP0434 /ASSEMBLY_ACC=CAM_ASM_000379 /LENGTH=314 /DNA_ID=CAMNT_0028184381 /DNA_START=28 /DNA_END=972 /DNA_ORIENTATION=-
MTFVKLVKNKAYFKRFQTKYRRRREGKTDYRARKRLVVMDKNKYMSRRYRFVVRFTNKTVICQVIYAEITGDRVMTSAYSSELPRYGVETGLKNYAAAYCTGLLCARRLLNKLGMDELYPGNEEVDGSVVSCEEEIVNSRRTKTFYVSELSEERRPFRALLDVGIRNTTTGARVFGALKGGADGGLDIPHSEKRFPGYNREDKEYDADVHRDRIFGQHVAEYMRKLQEEEPEKYSTYFATYIEKGVDADGLEAVYEACHAAIRADPTARAKNEKPHDLKYKNPTRRNLKQRKNRVKQKKAARLAYLQRLAESDA